MPDDERGRATPGGWSGHARRRSRTVAGAAWPGWLVLGAVVGGYGWWAVGLPPFSAAATIAVVLAGCAAAASGACLRRPARAAPPAVSVRSWAVVAAVGAAWQLAAYLQHPRHDHPTLSSLANAALGSQVARTAAFVGWLLAMVALVRR